MRRVLAFVAGAVLSPGISCRPARPAIPDSISISVPYEIDTLDPHAKDWAASLAIASNFYEPLVATDRRMRLRPALAQSWESPDPVTWIFHLRPSVRFHSGRMMKAADVVYSLKRLRDDRNLELGSYVFDIEEISAPDSMTVRIRTRRPVTILLAKLQYVYIVPAGSTGAELSARENGTGPYMLAEWKSGSHLGMRRYEGYWGEKPVFARARFSLGRSPRDAVRDLLRGESQLVQSNSREIESVIGSSGSFVIDRRSSLFVTFLAFNFSPEPSRFCSVRPNPFRDPRVRRAIDLAIDRHRIAALHAGRTLPAIELVAPFVFGFNPSIPGPTPDSAESRRLLQKAGFPDGFDVTLHTNASMADTATLVGEMLGAIGIRVNARTLPDPEFFDLLSKRQSALFLARYGCDTGDASEVFDQLIHSSDTRRRLGETNHGDYSNPAIDAAIEASAEEQSVAARSDMLRSLMARVLDDRPVIPLAINEDVFVRRKGYEWQPRGDSDIRAAEISFSARPDGF
jgi:peptide/nickel transport system substrate-binding protein